MGVQDDIKSQAHGAVKFYTVLDGDGRPCAVYEGPNHMAEDDPCTLTVTEYYTNGMIKKQLEGESQWPAGADVTDNALLNLFTTNPLG